MFPNGPRKNESILRKRVKNKKIELLRKRTLHVFDIVSDALSSIENLLQKGQMIMTRLDMEDRQISMKVPQVRKERAAKLRMHEENTILKLQVNKKIKISWEKWDLRLTNITNSDGDVPEYFHTLVSERARYKTNIDDKDNENIGGFRQFMTDIMD